MCVCVWAVLVARAGTLSTTSSGDSELLHGATTSGTSAATLPMSTSTVATDVMSMVTAGRGGAGDGQLGGLALYSAGRGAGVAAGSPKAQRSARYGRAPHPGHLPVLHFPSVCGGQWAGCSRGSCACWRSGAPAVSGHACSSSTSWSFKSVVLFYGSCQERAHEAMTLVPVLEPRYLTLVRLLYLLLVCFWHGCRCLPGACCCCCCCCCCRDSYCWLYSAHPRIREGIQSHV